MKASKSLGFSLIEVVVTLAALGVIASVAYVALGHVREAAREEKLHSDVKALNRAVMVYEASGGSLEDADSVEKVLAKLRNTVNDPEAERMPGLSSSMIDPRISAHMQTVEEGEKAGLRAHWSYATKEFILAESGIEGIKAFWLDEEIGETDGGTEDRSTAMMYASSDGWVWDYEDRTQSAQKVPTVNAVSSVSGPVTSSVDPFVPSGPVAPPSLGTLSAPQMSVPGGMYPISDYNIPVTLLDLNPAGAAQLLYSVNYGEWLVYSGTPIPVVPNDILWARAVPVDPAVYGPSSVAKEDYLVNPEGLLAPYVSPSSSDFTSAGPTVSVSIANPNDPSESRVDYRINGGSWTPYIGPFSLDSTDYPAGATIEAVALATAPYYLDSSVGSAAVGAAPPDPVTSLLDADSDTSYAATVPNWSGVTDQLYCNGLDPAQTVIYFDLVGKITGPATIKSATLHVTRTAGSDGVFNAHGILPGAGKWWINGITWNTAVNGLQTNGVELDAAPEDSATVSTVIPGVPGWSYRNRYDITDLVQRWADSPAANYGVALLGMPGQRIIYCSREHPLDVVRPKLVIEWEPSPLTTPPTTPPPPPTTTAPPIVPSLSAPQISVPGGTYPITDFNLPVSLVDTNPAGTARLVYCLNSSAWQDYNGTPVSVAPDDTLKAWALPVDPNVYGPSSVAKADYEASPVALLPPAISPSASAFTVAQPTVNVTITDANDPAVSGVRYRVNGGGWTDYVGAFTLNGTNFPGGATIEAVAVATAPHYLESSVASASIGAPPANASPFASGNGYSYIYTYSGTTPVITTTVLENDWDPDGDPLTVVGVTNGAHGTVTIDGTGNPRFTSSPTFIDGTDSFTYTISDGRGGTATATVTIMVNAKPVVANETVTTLMDTPVSGNVLANDWDHGGDPLIVEANENPLHGSVTIGANGNFTYTPNGGFTGSDSFRYTIADQEQGRTYGFVNITVTAPVVIQNLSAPQISVPGGTYPITGFNLSVTLANPNPAGTAQLKYSLNSSPWQVYTGTPITVAPNGALQAQAVAVNPALYASSGVVTANYQVSPVALLPPVITPSASGFSAAQPVVNVSIADANNPAVSQVQYRIQGGAWTPYAGVFAVSRASFPPGAAVLVESKAVPIAAHWLASPVASSSIDNSGATPPAAFITFCSGGLKNYGAVVIEGGTIKTSHSESGVEGDVAIAPGGTWSFSSGAVTGAFYAHAGTSGNLGSLDHQFGNGGSPVVKVAADFSTLKTQALTMSAQAASLPATQTFGKIDSTMTINANAPSGVNVIAIQEVALSGKVLTISGNADAYVIINVSDKIKMSGGGTWNISGGLKPSHVIFNMLNGSTEFGGTGGSGFLSGGIILAPFSSTKVVLTGSSVIIGNVITGKEFSMTGGSQLFANGCD